MSHIELIGIVMALLVIGLGGVAAALSWRERARQRSAELRRRFGPEYERAVEKLGSTEQAERELAERQRRVQHFRFKDLGALERGRLTARWNEIQAQFATDPVIAVTATNELINEVMRARGYPTLCYEERVADLSVEHPRVVQHYRAAHELSRSVYNGVLDTELLRQALVHYRMLFTELLQDSRGVSAPPAPLRHLPAPRRVARSVSRPSTVH